MSCLRLWVLASSCLLHWIFTLSRSGDIWPESFCFASGYRALCHSSSGSDIRRQKSLLAGRRTGTDSFRSCDTRTIHRNDISGAGIFEEVPAYALLRRFFTCRYIAQEALLKAYLSFGKFEGRSRFSTWLFRIAYNCHYDSLRTDGRRACEPIECLRSCDIDDETAVADRRFVYQDLYQAIGMLSVQEQAVILLFYMEEKSIKEITGITGMPSGTVRSCLSRGRAHLKVYLEKTM